MLLLKRSYPAGLSLQQSQHSRSSTRNTGEAHNFHRPKELNTCYTALKCVLHTLTHCKLIDPRVHVSKGVS